MENILKDHFEKVLSDLHPVVEKKFPQIKENIIERAAVLDNKDLDPIKDLKELETITNLSKKVIDLSDSIKRLF